SFTWFGLYLARGITVPIEQLAQGTREVAAGNLSYRVQARADDEIGILVDSFNRMTADLAQSKTRLEAAYLDLQAKHAELEGRRRDGPPRVGDGAARSRRGVRRPRLRLRRSDRAAPRAAPGRVARGRPAHRARDQEPAHADPALRPTPAPPARQPRRGREAPARGVHRDDHPGGRGAQAPRGRVLA